MFSQIHENGLPYTQKESPYDIAPQFPGGPKALNKYIEDSLRYDKSLSGYNKIGYVMLKFEVDTFGMLKNIFAINGISGAPQFVKESIRLLESMPHWIAAIKNNRKVNADYQLSIPFNKSKRKRH